MHVLSGAGLALSPHAIVYRGSRCSTRCSDVLRGIGVHLVFRSRDATLCMIARSQRQSILKKLGSVVTLRFRLHTC